MESNVTLKNCFLPQNRVLVLPIKQDKSSSVIINSLNNKEKPSFGKVIITTVADFDLGYTVFYSSYAGAELEIEKEKYLVLTKEDIVASFKQ